MRSKLLLCAIVALAASAYAKDPVVYQTGELLQMDSVPCDPPQNARSHPTALPGERVANKGTEPSLCQEYVLQSDRVVYRIRPRDPQHSKILPLGDRAQFRMQNDKMMLRLEDAGSKPHAYTVISMTPRTDSSAANAAPARINHLQ